MYWFTSDEHYGHANIIKYCNRPFKNVEEMNETLIAKHNKVVKKDDIVIHAGDFCWGKGGTYTEKYICPLNGQHIFLKGSHDLWLPDYHHEIWEKMIEKQYVVVCHYPMLRWARSHYGSWQLFGHTHGKLTIDAKQYDIGVDNNDYYPISFDKIKLIMVSKPDNPVNY